MGIKSKALYNYVGTRFFARVNRWLVQVRVAVFATLRVANASFIGSQTKVTVTARKPIFEPLTDRVN